MKFTLKLLLTCAALWLAFRNIAWADITHAMRTQELGWLLLAMLVVFMQAACGGLRWHNVRRALQTHMTQPALRTMMQYYASNCFNVMMPSTLGGDAARITMLKLSGDSVKMATLGVITDRLISLAGLGALVAATLYLLCGYIHMEPWIGALLGLCFYGGVITAYVICKRFVPNRLAMLGGLIWAAAAHICYASAAYMIARSLGIDITWQDALVLVPLVLFVSTLPISLGGWGIREIGMAGALALVGIEKAPAVLLGVQLGLISTLVNMSGALAFLALRK